MPRQPCTPAMPFIICCRYACVLELVGAELGRGVVGGVRGVRGEG